jgi:hypothetical protein
MEPKGDTMAGYFRREQEDRVDVKEFDRTTISTLLIPGKLVEQLARVIPCAVDEKNGRAIWDLKSGLKKLLSKYRGFLATGNLPFQHKPKLTFQDEGQDLRKFSFRPDDEDWFELGILAYGSGVSRCWLFSYLLSLELSGISLMVSLPEFRDGVTTPNISRPRLILQITGKKRWIHRKVHFRL